MQKKFNKLSLENQKYLIKNIFPQGIPINKKKQVWTPTLSLIYQAFEVSKASKIKLVELVKLMIISFYKFKKSIIYV